MNDNKLKDFFVNLYGPVMDQPKNILTVGILVRPDYSMWFSNKFVAGFTVEFCKWGRKTIWIFSDIWYKKLDMGIEKHIVISDKSILNSVIAKGIVAKVQRKLRKVKYRPSRSTSCFE